MVGYALSKKHNPVEMSYLWQSVRYAGGRYVQRMRQGDVQRMLCHGETEIVGQNENAGIKDLPCLR